MWKKMGTLNSKTMTVTERRIVQQDWYETETTKTGWASHGWVFDNGHQMDDSWTIVYKMQFDKHGNAWLGIAERDVNVTD